MKNTALINACPTCQTTIEWSTKNQYRPFCSERCKLIDLGDWANETRTIPSESPIDMDLEEHDQKE